MPSQKFESFDELSEDLQVAIKEIRKICKMYSFDIDECEADEYDCVKVFGEDMYKIYQLVGELDEITKS